MEGIEHQRFIEAVIAKHGIAVKVPNITASSYARTISRCFSAKDVGHSLLAMSMTAALIDHCREEKNYDPLLKLSTLIERALLLKSEDYDLEVTARELRAALFWGYLGLGQSDLRMLEAASRLFSALTGCSYNDARQADAVLSHGRSRGHIE